MSLDDLKNKKDKDLELVRDELLDMIQTGKAVLDHSALIARETGSPRSIEVYAKLHAEQAKVINQVLDFHDKIEKDTQESGVIENQTNNNLFIGTTTDIQGYIENQMKVVNGEETEDNISGE